MNTKFFIFFIILNIILSQNDRNKIIISFSCNEENIKYLHKVIYSILDQNVEQTLYKILIIFEKDINKKLKLYKEILFIFNLNIIRKIFINNKINLQTRLLIAIKEYPMNAILIISPYILFPDGWLEMLINDHKKYPNDVISSSIQYYFGQNLIIKELSEGYKGKYFGTFNHISNMIFNFAIINTELGGTLYPPNTFKNKFFFNTNLFLNISKESDEFWQSCFIIMEERILRQSSKIYDYTEYLINNQTSIQKIKIFEKIKKKFIKYFPNFKRIVELRQKKILVSFTSYPDRFGYLHAVVESIEKQILLPRKIILFLYEKDFNQFNNNLTGIEIIKVKEDIKSHKKYYYAMIKYRDYAIITLDDDIYYPPDTIISIYESYIKHPNIISGRRTHLIRYDKNHQIDKYINWVCQQQIITNPNYDIFITTGAGAIYPPDILNIDEKYINLIYEALTTDDITLKHYEINKGIESIWVPNFLMLGMKIQNITSKIKNKSLFSLNFFLNDIIIKKININISNKIITNWCIQYKNIKSGLFIHLFNINNINNNKNNKTFFDIDAYSYCPIDSKIKFQILFNKSIAYCFFKNSYSLINKNFNIYKTKKILKASCSIEGLINNLDEYLFPVAKSNNCQYIAIYNKRKYLSLIFKNFYCKNSFNCILIALSYKSRKKGYIMDININNKTFICKLNNKINYLNNYTPIIAKFSCKKILYNYNLKNSLISGINLISLNKNKNIINDIPNQFIIYQILIENTTNNTLILIKGKLTENLIKDLYNLTIFVSYPKLNLICYLSNSSKYVQSNIYCQTKFIIIGEILIESQIIYTEDFTENLLILNKLVFYQNYDILNIRQFNNNYYNKFFNRFIKKIYNFYKKSYHILMFIIILLKFYKNMKFKIIKNLYK